MNKINFKLFDYDGCLALAGMRHKDINLDDPQVYRDWLLENNKAFLDQLVEEIKAENYDLIIIGDGSKRQDYDTDLINKNAYKNGSFAWMLPLVQSYLAEKLKDKVVVLDPFMLADIGNDKKVGDSYKAILKTLNNEKDQVHSNIFCRDSKSPLIYTFAHRITTLNADVQIDMDFYDDNDSILLRIDNEISPHADRFLPDKLTLRLHQYETGKSCQRQPFTMEMKGKSKSDEYYDRSFSLITNKGIKYFLSHQEESKLKSNAELTHTSNYTTMEELSKQGLIPNQLTGALQVVNTATMPQPTLFGSPKPVPKNTTQQKELKQETRNTMT